MRVLFCAVVPSLAAEWRRAMDDTPADWGRLGLEVREESLLDVHADVLVSPANSFGFMDGGIDAVLARRFEHVESRVRLMIRREFAGELPVGQAGMCDLGPCSRCSGTGIEGSEPVASPAYADGRTCSRCVGLGSRHLIVAPTMRVPCRPTTPLAPYLATRAAVLLASRRAVEVLAVPGMGTGSAGIPLPVAARQMLAGWAAAVRPGPEVPHWNPHLLDAHDGLLGK